MHRTWSIVTPEYPPGCGGIGDYIELVAGKLAERGDHVTVFTRSPPGRVPTPNVTIELLPDDFGAATRQRLAAAWKTLPRNAVVLVQYVPQGFRRRGANLPFLRWLGARPERRWLMVHEAVFPFSLQQPPRRWVLAGITHLMLRSAARGAEHVFISIPAWERALAAVNVAVVPEWLPIPSTLGPDPAALVRPDLLPQFEDVPATVATFGTYGEFLSPPLKQVLPALLDRRADLEVVLLGGRSERFRDELLALRPEASARVRATGRQPPERVALELARAGVVIFPFIEGATTRRTSMMSALSVGAAVVTIDGGLSESFWRRTGAVSLYPPDRPDLGIEAVLALLSDPARRAAQRQRALELYHERFRLELVVEALERAYDARRSR